MKKVKPVLVLGIGNLLLKDEGVGIHLVQKMMKMHLPKNVEVLDGGTASLDLISYLEGRKKIVVVDCVRGGHKPGTIYLLTPENIEKDEKKILSLHQVDFQETLNLFSKLKKKMPKVVIIGIEPKDYSSWGMELSPVIKRRVPKIIGLVKKEIATSKNRI